MKKTKTIISIIVSILVLTIPVFMIWLVTAFIGLKLNYFIPIASFILVILIGLITYSLDNKKFLKKSIISISIIFVGLVLSVYLEVYYKNNYLPSITVGQNMGNYRKYLPFSDSEHLYRLEKEPSFNFSDNDELPKVDGATALFPIYCSFVENTYPKKCSVKDYVGFSTTKAAYENLINGKTDIIFVAQPSAQQLETAKEMGVEFCLYPIGYEAFVFVVNKKNPVDNITIQQLKDIYSGKITNWQELGGKNQNIRPFQREEGSGSQTAFLATIGKDLELLPPETHQVVDGMGGLIDKVADYQNHGNAIGYSFRYYVENMEENDNIKILNLNGIEATKENIRSKAYPITDNFYAITVKGKESESVKQFIQWILSNEGQKIVEEVGYVPIGNSKF